MAAIIQWSRNILQKTLGVLRTCVYKTFYLLRRHKVPFLTIQVGYYGTVATAMGITLMYPKLQANALARTTRQLETGIGRFALSAYDSKNVPFAAFVTFVINLTVGAYGTITLPSLLVPFSGLALTFYRAIEWGLLFAPIRPESISIWHAITLIIEGQGFVLAATAAWLQSLDLYRQLRSIVLKKAGKQGESTESESKERAKDERYGLRWPNYQEGNRIVRQFYGPVALVLLVSAVWEAYEVIHLSPLA